MLMQLVSAATALLGALLLVRWWRAHRRSDRGACLKICALGAGLALAHLLWELYWVKQGGPPAKGSPEQRAMIFRLAGLAFPANLLLVIGLFELSFRARRR